MNLSCQLLPDPITLCNYEVEFAKITVFRTVFLLGWSLWMYSAPVVTGVLTAKPMEEYARPSDNLRAARNPEGGMSFCRTLPLSREAAL